MTAINNEKPEIIGTAEFGPHISSRSSGGSLQNKLAYISQKKSAPVAYLLLLALGIFGAHNFYVGQKALAWTELSLFVVVVTLTNIGGLMAELGGTLIMVFLALLIFDLFMLAKEVRKFNLNLAGKYNVEVRL